MTQPFPDDSIERARRYSTEEKQELERQLGEMTSTEPTQPIPPTDVDLVARAFAYHPEFWEFCTLEQAAKTAVDALARAGRLHGEHAVPVGDVDLIARHMAVLDGPPGRGQERWDALDDIERRLYVVKARGFLSLLAERGRLLPEGAETRTEEWWGVLRRTGGEVESVGGGSGAFLLAQYGALNGGGKLMRRVDRLFADGSKFIGPWLPAPSPSTEETPTDG